MPQEGGAMWQGMQMTPAWGTYEVDIAHGCTRERPKRQFEGIKQDLRKEGFGSYFWRALSNLRVKQADSIFGSNFFQKNVFEGLLFVFCGLLCITQFGKVVRHSNSTFFCKSANTTKYKTMCARVLSILQIFLQRSCQHFTRI